MGNPTLAAEEVTTLEMGTGYHVKQGGTRYEIFANGFVSNVDQVIERVDETGGLTELSNQSGYDVLGIEGEARLTLPGGHVLFANGAWHRAYWGHQTVDGNVSCRLFPGKMPPRTVQRDHGCASAAGELGELR